MLFTEPNITVDAVGDPEAITAPRECKWLKIRPKGPSPTIAYYVRAPLITDPQVYKYPGEETLFKAVGVFNANQVVGYVEMVSGSEDFTVEVGY